MRILLMPVGSAGDVHPFIGLGLHLQKRGHVVTFATAGYFRGVVESAGLTYQELGTREEFMAGMDDPRVWHPTQSMAFFAELAEMYLPRTFEAVLKHAEGGDAVVVAGTLAFGARVAQEVLKVPMATVHLQPSIFFSVDKPPKFPAYSLPSWFPRVGVRAAYALMHRMVDRSVGEPINRFRATFALPPARRIMGDWWHSPDLTLALFPEWYAPPQRDWPPSIKTTGFPLYDGAGAEVEDPGMQEFLMAGSRPVVFTAGSAMKFGHDFFRASAEACRRLGCRGILLTRFPEQLPPTLPEGVRHFSYAPFSKVFRASAAVVHHGGIGTTAQALSAGVPQLIVPQNHDQPDNAARIVALGAGATIPFKSYKAERVAGVLKDLINNHERKRRCEDLALRMDGPAALEKACDAIEGLKRTKL